MFHKFNPLKYVNYYNTLLVVIFLSSIALPLLWFISEEHFSWAITCTLLWGIGVFLIYYPFMEYVFPLMITRIGAFMLGAILALFTLWLNSTIIISLLSAEDVELILNRSLFTISIDLFSLILLGYMVLAGIFVANLNLKRCYAVENNKQLAAAFRSHTLPLLFTPHYFLGLFLVFVLPVLFLFWADVTYSTRIFLSFLSILSGAALFFYTLKLPLVQQRLIVSFLSAATIIIINGGILNLIGLENIPASTVTSKIIDNQLLHHLEARDTRPPSFQFANNQKSKETSIYKIVASVPTVNLYLGYKVDTIPEGTIHIESTSAQYTVYDQFNRELTRLKK